MVNLEEIIKKLSKKYIIAGNKEDSNEYISTGNLALDLSLGGGIAWGYATEWSGKSGSGKTLMLQLMLAYAQQKYGAIGVWFDREKAWFRERATELGIDVDKVILIPPEDIVTVGDAELKAKEILADIPSDVYKFIAIDSISAFAKEGFKADMGKKAKSLHELFRAILPYVNNNTSFNFTNQRTFKIGILFGNPETTTGGEGPKYYSTYRIKLDDRNSIKDDKKGGEIVGNWIQALIIKTRRGPNYRDVTFPFFFKEGIPYYGGYARLLVDRNFLKPKNKKDFLNLKQVTVIYKDKQFSEHDIERFVEEHPELLFNKFPEYNQGDKDANEDGEGSIVEPTGEEDNSYTE